MRKQNRFVGLINDIVTSPYFARVLTFIGLSISLGLLTTPILGFIAVIITAIILVVFIIVLFYVSEKTYIGYELISKNNKWKILDQEGQTAKSSKKRKIRLKRPLETFVDLLEAEETLVDSNNILIAQSFSVGTNKRTILSLGATYPKGWEHEYTLYTERELISDRDGKYVQTQIFCPTKEVAVQIEFPDDTESKLTANLLHKKGGDLVPVDNNSKTDLSVSDSPPRINWKSNKLSYGTDYLITWMWSDNNR